MIKTIKMMKIIERNGDDENYGTDCKLYYTKEDGRRKSNTIVQSRRKLY